jgi:uncharacterized membrane protein
MLMAVPELKVLQLHNLLYYLFRVHLLMIVVLTCAMEQLQQQQPVVLQVLAMPGVISDPDHQTEAIFVTELIQ